MGVGSCATEAALGHTAAWQGARVGRTACLTAWGLGCHETARPFPPCKGAHSGHGHGAHALAGSSISFLPSLDVQYTQRLTGARPPPPPPFPSGPQPPPPLPPAPPPRPAPAPCRRPRFCGRDAFCPVPLFSYAKTIDAQGGEDRDILVPQVRACVAVAVRGVMPWPQGRRADRRAGRHKGRRVMRVPEGRWCGCRASHMRTVGTHACSPCCAARYVPCGMFRLRCRAAHEDVACGWQGEGGSGLAAWL